MTLKKLQQGASLVSIIIPVFNVAELLGRCVDSVFAQTYQNLEIILINDGSTDSSGELCDIYAQRDPRVRVIHQTNQGLSAARNTGLAIASGEFVSFIDSDDVVAPTLIEHLLDLCLVYHTDLSICSFVEFSSVMPLADTALPSNADDIRLASTLDTLNGMLLDQGFTVSAWGKLYARSIFQGVRFPVGRLYEDVGTTYRLVLQCDKIAISNAPLYFYYQNPASITQQPFSMKKLDLISLTDQMCDDLESWAKTKPIATQQKITCLSRERRIHARFSVLRQIVLAPAPATQEEHRELLTTERDIVKYIRENRRYITKNPLATARDKIALRSLQLGLPIFKKAWQFYQRRK